MSSERRSNSCWNSFLTTKELGKTLNLSTRFSHINTHMEQSTGKRRWLNMHKLKAAMMRKFRTCSSISSFFPPLIYFLPRLFLIRTWCKPQKHIKRSRTLIKSHRRLENAASKQLSLLLFHPKCFSHNKYHLISSVLRLLIYACPTKVVTYESKRTTAPKRLLAGFSFQGSHNNRIYNLQCSGTRSFGKSAGHRAGRKVTFLACFCLLERRGANCRTHRQRQGGHWVERGVKV